MATSRPCFVIETMEVVDGQKLKSAHPDKDGYYTVPLAVIGRTTLNHTYYIPEQFIESMTGVNSPFAMQVRNGTMYGEWGHPYTKDLNRISIVMEKEISHHIRKVYTRDLGDGTTLILGEIKPFGPYGKHLEESLANPWMNTAFSLRSLCTEVFNRMENRVDRTIKYFVTFDAVGSSGYKESTKRFVNLGTGSEGLSHNVPTLIDKTNISYEISHDQFFTEDGGMLPAFESSHVITDEWLLDFFGAKEIRLSTQIEPVRHFSGSDNVIAKNGNRQSLISALWS